MSTLRNKKSAEVQQFPLRVEKDRMARALYRLTTGELAAREIASDALEWLLSFVNLGTWKKVERGTVTFVTGVEATPDEYRKLIANVEAFCGELNITANLWSTSYGNRLTQLDLVDLQTIAANILLGLTHKNGVVSQPLPECKVVMFLDERGMLLRKLTGNRKARFIDQLTTLLETIDLTKLRHCHDMDCLKFFYATSNERRPRNYCSDQCSSKTRSHRFRLKKCGET
jgi:hypothetical protein